MAITSAPKKTGSLSVTVKEPKQSKTSKATKPTKESKATKSNKGKGKKATTPKTSPLDIPVTERSMIAKPGFLSQEKVIERATAPKPTADEYVGKDVIQLPTASSHTQGQRYTIGFRELQHYVKSLCEANPELAKVAKSQGYKRTSYAGLFSYLHVFAKNGVAVKAIKPMP